MELQTKLPEYLLQRGIDYHCRKGIRPGCDCSYCQEKLLATHSFKVYRYPRYLSPAWNSYDWDIFFHGDREARHEEQRHAIHIKLAERKQEL